MTPKSDRTTPQPPQSPASPASRRRGGRDQHSAGNPLPGPQASTEQDWHALLGGRTPTPVQAAAVPALLAGRDVITTARTGSGKTLAFLIPAAARGIGVRAVSGMRPEVLIVTPTRELAVQVRDVARELGMTAGRITGGITPAQTRREASGKGVIVGTPGRLKDLINQGELNLAALRYAVLDEADELLSLGFLRDVGDILRAAQQQVQAAPGDRKLQLAMASATFPAEIRAVAERFMRHPERIDVAPAQQADTPQQQDILGGATDATHLLINTGREELMDVAAEQIREALRNPGGCVVVFCRTKSSVQRRAKQLAALLPEETVSPLEGNMDQKKRERTMGLLREGVSRVLVATDIAGRGIDLPEVRLVIHMDIAATPEDHVHRSGRTARAGRKGVNLVLLVPEQRALWQTVRRRLPEAIRPAPTPEEGRIDPAIQQKQGQGRTQPGRSPGQPGNQTATQKGTLKEQGGRPRESRKGKVGVAPTPAGTGAGRVGPQRARRRR
ncbi:DEAD/DEAH box helicase [Deinococcus metallilatus]|uniref:RNA helicase n=1 Tax=Deinococcus metallilatus TaxID=1211322 RepID=A0AAJ5F5B8_9DEIO|nr:DEAD/DEAH box helicase [Deinococcus metallilatus]MBB5295365.1 ATP-dependent RNA helicase RhlE [Deinococcus metallilatus]QBY08101.1 DEAD/DEAH box helicase [Deinococcus metallilatus]RXJ12436.1 DEAD/DEAH box helicase [Deinococcus metallilatus]TLK21081.1 DEAD/DEAH box helicase [Deinococcus metallilatus]GMA16042.1 RNA helicase [Deinococcus metallilatus]